MFPVLGSIELSRSNFVHPPFLPTKLKVVYFKLFSPQIKFLASLSSVFDLKNIKSRCQFLYIFYMSSLSESQMETAAFTKVVPT